MIYFRFAGYALIFLVSLGCFFRFRSDLRRWFFLSMAVAMASMAISAASSRLAHRNELAARIMELRQTVADGKETLAKADPKQVENDPQLRDFKTSIQHMETELDDLSIAPAILPSVPWNSVETFTALGGLVAQVIGLVQVLQWYRSTHNPKGNFPQTSETQLPSI